MAKAIFEPPGIPHMSQKTDPTFDAPVTVKRKDLDSVEDSSSKAFSVKGAGGKAIAKVVPKDAKPIYSSSGRTVSVAPASMTVYTPSAGDMAAHIRKQMGAAPAVSEPSPSITPVRNINRESSSNRVSVSGPLRNTTAYRPGSTPGTVYRSMGENEGYQRGYNPEQMRNVRDAENAGHLTIESSASTMPDRRIGRGHHEFEEHLTREALARSRQPIHEIANASNPLTINLVDAPSSGAGGHYEPVPDNNGRYNIFIKAQNGSIRADDEKRVRETFGHRSKTIIHELGHHADPDLKKYYANPYNSGKKGVSEYGRGEGFADAYQDKNHVPDPRSTTTSRSLYPYYAQILHHSTDPETKSWSTSYVSAGGELGPTRSPLYDQVSLDTLPKYADALGNADKNEKEIATHQLDFIHPKTGRPTTYNFLIHHLARNQ